MKMYLIGVFLLCLSMGSRPPVKAPVPSPEITVPTSGMLHITRCTNCTPDQWKFIKEAEVKTNETVASTCFSSFMLQRSLIQTLSKSNKQVVESLVDAKIAIEVEMYYSIKKVLGYTYSDVKKEWINSRYMLKWNRCDLASLLGHETSHKVGYDHDYYHNASRPFSVPYSINEAIDKCCVR